MTSAPDVGAEDCEFCSIAQGDDDSAEVVCEGETWVAFFPLKPATPGHTLVIPRQHVSDLWSVDPSLGADLMTAAIQVGRAIQVALTPEGMNLITSSGEAADQTIFHLHLHVVPRYHEDGFGHIWPPKQDLGDIDMEGVADRVREACRAVK